MNTCCSTSSTPLPAAPVTGNPLASRGPFAALQRWFAGAVSVDLMDTIFATLPRRDGAPYEAVVRPTDPTNTETGPLPLAAVPKARG
jgi:hypothetical protein